MRVLVVDDHRVLAESMALVLGSTGGYAEVCVAHSAGQARELILAQPFERAIVDVRLPDAEGTTLVGEVLAAHPAARVVVLTASPHPQVRARALAAGACAVLAKGSGLAGLLEVLEAGSDPHEPEPDQGRPLTTREVEILRVLARGRDTQGVARELAISVHTVREHLKNIHAKLGVSSQLDAVVTAHRAGVIDIDAAS